MEPLNKFTLVASWEQCIARVKLCDDAPKRPHVDALIIGHAEYDLGTPVKATLYVHKSFLIAGATGSIIYNFDLFMSVVRKQDVLRLQITVDNLQLHEQVQRLKELSRNISYLFKLKSFGWLRLQVSKKSGPE